MTTPAPTANTADVIGSYLDALTTGDLDLIRAHFADDATWHIHGDLPLSGTYRGADAIMSFLATAMGQLFTPSSQQFTFTRTHIAGDTAVVEWSVTGTGAATSRRYDNDYCGVFVVSRGRIDTVREYLDSDHVRHVLYGDDRSASCSSVDTRA